MGAALLEPVGINTTPAIALAALAAMQNEHNPVLIVTTADQTVADTAAFTTALHPAIEQASVGQIAIQGIAPSHAATGHVYINTGLGTMPALPERDFVKKPNAFTAQRYLDKGGYQWNASIFVFKTSVWLLVLEQHTSDILQSTQTAVAGKTQDVYIVRPGKDEFAAISSESIDSAVIEHYLGSNQPISMVPLDAGWSDLGVWDAVWSVLPKDEHCNAHVGDVPHTGSHNTLYTPTAVWSAWWV